MHVTRSKAVLLIGSAAMFLGLSPVAAAQTTPATPPAAADTPAQQSSDVSEDKQVGLADIIVTASKRGQAQNV